MAKKKEPKDKPKGPSKQSRGRLGGLTTSATHDMNEVAANARKGLQRRFEDEVDPERTLSEEERARRVDAAKRLFYQRLSLKGAAARSEKSKGKK